MVITINAITASAQEIGKDAISQFAVLNGSYGNIKYTHRILKTIIAKTDTIEGESEYFIPLSIPSSRFIIPQIKYV